MATVTMPDGTAVEMPDQVDPVLGGRLRAFQQAQNAPKQPKEIGVGDVAKGVGDAALSGAAKVSTGIVGGAVGLVNRLMAAASGGDPEMAAQVAKEYVNEKFGHDTTTPVGKAI